MPDLLFRAYVFLLGVLVAPLFPVSGEPTGFTTQLDRRYAPFVDWRQKISGPDLDSLDRPSVWWRSPAEIRAKRVEVDQPLSGLHLAIDPGHIGGEFASGESRSFRISEEDFLIREGELVLEVAFRIREKLRDYGAEVTLLRESFLPVRDVNVIEELEVILPSLPMPSIYSCEDLSEYLASLERLFFRRVYVIGELRERARLVNEMIRPDALLSLHINAAPWPKDDEGRERVELVENDHTHHLIFGCLTPSEFERTAHRERMLVKLKNGSGKIERLLAHALGEAFFEKSGLPASEYQGRNAYPIGGKPSYVWARNLLMLREVDCPVVLLEPYVANSNSSYPRLQSAIGERLSREDLSEDDILVEYADAVSEAILRVYGPETR